MKGTYEVKSARYEIIKNELSDAIPKLKITLLNEEEEEIRVGYLSPYRRYCFQVSANSRGDGDLASTITMDLHQLIIGAAKPYGGSQILLELIYLAITRFAGCDAGIFNSVGNTNTDTLFKFVHEAMNWLVYNRAEEIGLKDYYPWVEDSVAYCDI